MVWPPLEIMEKLENRVQRRICKLIHSFMESNQAYGTSPYTSFNDSSRPVLSIDLAVWSKCALAHLAGLTRLHTAVVSRAYNTDLRQAVVGQLGGVSIVLIYTD
jgi:hypothetical protein